MQVTTTRNLIPICSQVIKSMNITTINVDAFNRTQCSPEQWNVYQRALMQLTHGKLKIVRDTYTVGR